MCIFNLMWTCTSCFFILQFKSLKVNSIRFSKFVSMSYCLISWGANSHGQLGQGIRSEECALPREVDLSHCKLQAQEIKKIVGGAGHTLILDNYGRVYACGWNNRGQVGFPTKENVLSFRQLNEKLEDKDIVDIACGWDCSAALTIEGTLLLWGSNCFGQLGKHPDNLQWTHEPFEVPIDCKIKGISIGLRHTALVTEDYKILVTGTGSKGQLGLGSLAGGELLNAVYTFREVPTLRNVVDVSCGQHHTFAITKDGKLYAFGDNKHGQLGLCRDEIQKTSIPTKLSNTTFKFPVKTYSGWSHVIVQYDGQIFGWGRNTYGQLGNAKLNMTSTSKAVKIEHSNRKVHQVSVGAEHNIVLTEDGTILCWGWNEHGNCGNGNTNNVIYPAQLELPYDYRGILIGSGTGHSFAVIQKL